MSAFATAHNFANYREHTQNSLRLIKLKTSESKLDSGQDSKLDNKHSSGKKKDKSSSVTPDPFTLQPPIISSPKLKPDDNSQVKTVDHSPDQNTDEDDDEAEE